MMDIDLSGVANLYSENINQRGHSPKSVGWNDESSQQLRFEYLLQVADDLESSISINDLGCGYGALYIYLSESTDITVDRYVGYDVSEEMIDAARQLIGDRENVELHTGDMLTETADYSFASGIFNVRFDHDQGTWEDYMKRIIENLHSYSDQGFAFNALTSHVDYMEDHLYYADPSEFLDFVLEELSRDAVLYHDYDLYEWTITVSTSNQ